MDGEVGFNIDAKTGEVVIVLVPPPGKGATAHMTIKMARNFAAQMRKDGGIDLAVAIENAADMGEQMGAAVKDALAKQRPVIPRAKRPSSTIH